jgi:signal transduction histidine kinase
MAQHAFTELLNNAIDHSGGTQVTVSMRQTPLHLQLLVSDDGCGLFDASRPPTPSPTRRWPCSSSARAS